MQIARMLFANKRIYENKKQEGSNPLPYSLLVFFSKNSPKGTQSFFLRPFTMLIAERCRQSEPKDNWTSFIMLSVSLRFNFYTPFRTLALYAMHMKRICGKFAVNFRR